jgi:hypothetical protein
MELRRYLSGGLAALSATLVAVILSAWPALATAPATGPVVRPSLTPSPETVQVGEQIRLTVTGFQNCVTDEGGTLTMRWDGEPLTYALGSGSAEPGSFMADATVPPSPLGLNQVDVVCSVENTEERNALQAQGSVYVVTLTPSVQIVQAGQPVTITGSGFTQCTDSAGNTTVDLSANGTQLATASGSNGDFQQVITVPPASPAGPYPVTAQCTAQPGINLTSTNVSVVTLALSSSSGTPGTVIGVTGGGFTQCREVQLQLLQDTPQAVVAGSLVVPADGSFTTGVTVPSSAAPGNDYQVDAGCYPAADGNAPMAIEQFTVTSSGSLTAPPTSPTPRLTSSTPASSTTSSSARSGAGSPSSTSPTARLRSTSSSSSGSPTPTPTRSAQPSGRADGLGEPVALVGGGGAGLALVALLLVRALSMVHGRRGRGWVNKHLRVAAGWGRPLSARVERRRGAMSVSVGLQPHFDGLRNTQNEEAAR